MEVFGGSIPPLPQIPVRPPMASPRFRFLLSAGEVVPGGSLAPPLAPFGLELPRLVREINDRSLARYVRGTPVVVRLAIQPPRQWSLRLDPPPFSHCLRSLGPQPSRPALYGLLLVLARERSLPPRQLAPSFFGSLGSQRPPPKL